MAIKTKPAIKEAHFSKNLPTNFPKNIAPTESINVITPMIKKTNSAFAME